MNAAAKGSCLVAMGIFVAFSGRPAYAGEGPLLVVVEAPPALDADAEEIRRAISTELHSPTVAPTETTGEPVGRVLIVALDRDRIAMSLRAGDSAPIVRIIPAPAGHAARLRAIAWLAGNLARDQVTPIVAEAPIDMPSLATIPQADTVTNIPATDPPPLEPSSDVLAISTQAQGQRTSATHFWSIGAADGPTTNFPLCKQPSGGWPSACAPFSTYGTAWRLEVQRRSRREGFFQGAAVEGTVGNAFAPQLVGTSAFIGFAKRYEKWAFESTFGAGLELSYGATTVLTATHSSTDGFVSNISNDDSLRPALSVDGAVAVAHPISESLDAVLRVGAHLATDDFSAWFLSTTLGLRYNLL